MQSYRVLWLGHRHLTFKYRQLVAEGAASKRLHHLKSPGQIYSFLEGVKKSAWTSEDGWLCCKAFGVLRWKARARGAGRCLAITDKGVVLDPTGSKCG
jgi:hypothetical protein